MRLCSHFLDTTPFAGNLSETNFNYSKVPIKAKYVSNENFFDKVNL